MKLSLVDLSSIFWSSWHATAGGGPDAAYLATLERVDRCREGFDRVAVCCDIGPSWRKKEFPDYKANRPERDPAAYDQLRRVREKLEAEGVPTLAVEGFEADDLIATLACKAPGSGYYVVIFTGDKDLCQLVQGNVTVQSVNGKQPLYDREAVKQKFGVYPERLGDWLALVGDKSDNVPGLPGCGEVNASRLLNELGSLENMFAAPDGVTPPTMRDKFRANVDGIKLARRLVSLSFDVPLDFEESTRPRPRTPGKVIDAEFSEVDEPEHPADSGGSTSEVSGESPSGHRGKEGSSVDSVPTAESTQSAPPRASESATSAPKPAAEAVATALVLDKQDPRWTLALEPRGIQQLLSYCQHLSESQLYRKFPNADAIMAVVLRGRSMGLDMTTSLDVFNVIKGKPTMGAMAIVGVCLASGKAEFFDPIECNSETEATWETKRRGGRKPIQLTYTIDDAKRAGLTRPSDKGEESNWVKRPKPMLRKQAAVELARLVYPDVVANIYDPDEMTD